MIVVLKMAKSMKLAPGIYQNYDGKEMKEFFSISLFQSRKSETSNFLKNIIINI